MNADDSGEGSSHSKNCKFVIIYYSISIGYSFRNNNNDNNINTSKNNKPFTVTHAAKRPKS
jgi:hypothetical protein